MLSFVVGSLVSLVVVGVASIEVARDVASQAALREARLRGGAFSRSIVAPLLDTSMVGGRVAPGSSLGSVLRTRLEDGTVTHIKLWDKAGRIIWADEPTLVGQIFPLEPEVLRIFDTGGVVGDVTHLDKPENVLEADEGQLLEVYAGAVPDQGPSLVVETYWAMERIDDAQWALLRELVPLVLGALLLFQLAVFPLALSLARRVDRSRAERAMMMHHALSASELERHRIAAQLHDGVIQDLAGIGFALPTIAASLHGSSDATRQLLAHTHRTLLQDVDQLRTMLIELHPASLADGRLDEAVQTLVLRAEREGLRTTVQVAPTQGQSPAVIRMAYRIVREGVQNVFKHAQAESLEVTAGPDGPDYVVRVVDDGQGIQGNPVGDGHIGLKLLGDTLTDLGGSLTLTAGSTGGTVLEARFPTAMEDPVRLPDRRAPGRRRSLARRLSQAFSKVRPGGWG